jgi:N-acetylglucosaminyldiphosphoundecaprenol N-acetyl-beta-D-mannosaminyltransferase
LVSRLRTSSWAKFFGVPAGLAQIARACFRAIGCDTHRKPRPLAENPIAGQYLLPAGMKNQTPPHEVEIQERHSKAGATFSILGVRVNAVQIPDVIREMETWISRRDGCRYIAVTGMHGITEAQHDRAFNNVLRQADLVVPDGMPIVWLGRLRGHAMRRRVYGPELMLTFCRDTISRGYRHFLFGGDVGVAEQLANGLTKQCPGISVVGAHTPPFRPMTPDEDMGIVDAINEAAPDVLWVGLSTPKQEKWMHEHRERLRVPVTVGVGAAFDFLSRRKRQAPRWMQENGLEWLFRLAQEPARLWKRYLIGGAQFIFLVVLEMLGIRRFEADSRP